MRRSRLEPPAALALALCAAAWLLQWGRMALASGDSAPAWLLPPLVLFGLILLRRRSDPGAPPSRAVGWAGAAGLALALAARMFLEPFPGWPLGEWAYGAGLAALAFALVAGCAGVGAARGLLGPFAFALAALPWPAFVASGLMGRLREGMAAALAEVFTLFGQPAMAAGTVLQVGRGAVGIDEACGGIRSLQAAVLLSLAIGELREASGRRRIGLLAAGIGLALAANALRLATLTEICARAGTEGVGRWHGRMDLLEFAVVIAGLGALAWRLPSLPPLRPAAAASGPKVSRGWALAICTLVLLPLDEVAARIWFRQGGAPARTAAWTAELPNGLPSFAPDPWTPAMQSLLACDGHQLGHWRGADGRLRAAYVLEWSRGRNAPYTLSLHNPGTCLPLSGLKPVGPRPGVAVEAGGRRLPFAASEFAAPEGRLTVYSLAWNITAGTPLGGADAPGSPTALGWPGRWREVAAGRRAIAVREVVVAIFDAPDAAAADRAFLETAAGIIHPPAGD